jgi:hypothetical protein
MSDFPFGDEHGRRYRETDGETTDREVPVVVLERVEG